MIMIEKVARALCEAQGFKWEDQADAMTNASGGDDERDHYLEQARAAIEALREPNQEMLSIDAPDMPAGGDVGDIWRDMIDKALNSAARGRKMIWQQNLDQIRTYIRNLEESLAESDALIAAHAAKIDSGPRDKWPKGSLLENAVARHERRVLDEQMADCYQRSRVS